MQQTIRAAVTDDPRAAERAGALTVLHVTAPGAAGGLETVVSALASGHVGCGHSMHVAAVVTPGQLETPLLGRLRANGVAVHEAVLSARAYREERAFLARLCRKIGPDIVHTHGYRSDFIGGSVALRMELPTISTVHGFTYSGVRGRLYEWLQKRALRRFHAVVAVSRPQVAQLMQAGIDPRRIHLIRNAAVVTDSKWVRDPATRDGRFNVGWVGRLSHEKGADLLIDALAAVRDLPIMVSLIGEGADRGALEARAARHGVAERIQWHGLVMEPQHLFRQFDVFVLSSRTEGTPIVLFEAIAAGVPVVATAVGGVPDVVSDDEALLVPPAAHAIAAAIRRVHADPHGAALRAEAARARLAREFAVKPWLDRYEALYRSTCSSRLSNGVAS